jgi:transposase
LITHRRSRPRAHRLKLYAIEKEILDAAARQKARNERSRPLVVELERFLRERRPPVAGQRWARRSPISSTIGAHLVSRRRRLEMDTNPVEIKSGR